MPVSPEHVVAALRQLGGDAHVGQITAIVEKIAPLPHPNSVRASVRRILQEHCRASDQYKDPELFLNVHGLQARKGIWRLANGGEVAVGHSDPVEGTEQLGVLPALERLGFDVEVDPDQAPSVQRPALLDPEEAEEQPFNPASHEDARDKVLREIRARRGQKQFRDALIEAYEGRCAITGCDVLHVLEAAHITPYLGPETNHVTNGFLLRADIHTLFDTNLIAVDPDTRKVLVSPTIQAPMYRALHGQTLRATKTKASAPSGAALWQHREACDF
jgi:hypothetical protein